MVEPIPIRQNFVTEAVWRTTHGRMVPADAETVLNTPDNIKEYRRIFPATPDWYREEWFPTGVPAPTPPAVFFYHGEIMRTTNQTYRTMWDDIIMLEWAALFTAAWWHEAARGRRGWVVPHETIQWLGERLEDIVIDPDGPEGVNGPATAHHALRAMESVAATQYNDRNTVLFPGTRLRQSEFVWTTPRTGFFDARVAARRQFIRSEGARGRLQELHAAPDPYGYRPRINHAQRQRPLMEEPDPRRRRVDDGSAPQYRPVSNPPPPQQRDRDPRPPAQPRGRAQEGQHPAYAMSHRQAVYRHNAPT